MGCGCGKRNWMYFRPISTVWRFKCCRCFGSDVKEMCLCALFLFLFFQGENRFIEKKVLTTKRASELRDHRNESKALELVVVFFAEVLIIAPTHSNDTL